MPRVRRRLRSRLQRSLDDLDLNTLLALVNGYRRRCEDTGNIGMSLDEARDLYDWNRDEFNRPYQPGVRSLMNPDAGRRFWVVWMFDLLPEDPRRRVRGTGPATSDEPPRPFTDPFNPRDDYESSYSYLKRRGLLSAAELEALGSNPKYQPYL